MSSFNVFSLILQRQRTRHTQRRLYMLEQVSTLHPKQYFEIQHYAMLHWRNFRLYLERCQTWAANRRSQPRKTSVQALLKHQAINTVDTLLTNPIVTPLVGVHNAIEHVLTIEQACKLKHWFTQWCAKTQQEQALLTQAMAIENLAFVIGQWRLYGMLYLRSIFKGVVSLSDDTVQDLLNDGFGERLGHFDLKVATSRVILLRVVL